MEATELRSAAPRNWGRPLLLTSLGLLLTATAALPVVGSSHPSTQVSNRAGAHRSVAPLDTPDLSLGEQSDGDVTTTEVPHTTTTVHHTTTTEYLDGVSNPVPTTVPGGPVDPTWPPVVPNPKVTQFDLPRSNSYGQSIVSGPDGNLWFAEATTRTIGRITPSGDITEFQLDDSFSTPTHIVSGPDNALWFDDGNAPFIGRITSDGDITKFALAPKPPAYSLTAGPDGNLWLSGLDEHDVPYVARMTPAGIITTFPMTVRPMYLAAGPGGYVWSTYSESSNADAKGGILRISVDGSVKKFTPFTSGGGFINRLVRGPDDALWFTYQNWNGPAEGIGRMTESGDFALTPLPDFCGDSLVFGRDNALWVSGGRCNPSKVFRIVLGGAITTFEVNRPGEIITGPDGNIWFMNDVSGAVGRIGLDGS